MIKAMFKQYGYTDKQIEKILESYIFRDRGEEFIINWLKEKFEFFSSVGYTKSQILKMTVVYPSLFTYGIDNFVKKIEFLKSLGYADEEVIKITCSAHQVYGHSVDSIMQKIEEIESLGYKREQVLKIMLLSTSLFASGVNTIKQKFNYLETLGYTKEEVLKITNFFPNLYGVSIDNIKGKMDVIQSLGYSKEEVLKLILGLPTLLGYSNEHLKEKFSFFIKMGLRDVPLSRPRNLMQSVDLTYARFRFLTEERNKEISMKTVSSLFAGSNLFQKTYKISKDELLARYSYDLDVRSKNKKRLLDQK